ncbi:MAG: molybdenum cofactor guanylyltransferase [Myxococcales bacterium]|nr:molybdenum cofactor guanylyltransferase [Myxococcales bacterium]
MSRATQPAAPYAPSFRHGFRPGADAPLLAEPAGMRAERMLLIGATSRDAGKTEFASRVLRAAARSREVVGIKVTPVDPEVGGCPRGECGCGLCARLDAPFEIVEEDGRERGKDTVRLLESGARRVFWLRARRPALAQGMAALLDRIGPEALCLCEGNSVRQVVEPGWFVMVRGPACVTEKPSARAALSLADVVTSRTETGFSVSPEEFSPGPSSPWSLRLPATAVVLAGGLSRRMGRDKALLELGGRSLIERVAMTLSDNFAEVLLSVDRADRFPSLPYSKVADAVPGQGPLRGVVSALRAASYPLVFFATCDLENVPVFLVHRLLRAARGHQGAVLLNTDGWPEPLFSVLHRDCLPHLEGGLERGERRLARLFGALRLRYVPVPAQEPLLDLNTPEDYRRACERQPGRVLE